MLFLLRFPFFAAAAACAALACSPGPGAAIPSALFCACAAAVCSAPPRRALIADLLVFAVCLASLCAGLLIFGPEPAAEIWAALSLCICCAGFSKLA